MATSEFEAFITDDLRPIRFDPGSRPSWATGIPDVLLHSAFASGSQSVDPQQQNVPGQIGGFDIWRHGDEKDGVNLNKDHYYVVLDKEDPENLFVFGPFKEDPNTVEDEHHLDNLPDRLISLIVQKD